MTLREEADDDCIAKTAESPSVVGCEFKDMVMVRTLAHWLMSRRIGSPIKLFFWVSAAEVIGV